MADGTKLARDLEDTTSHALAWLKTILTEPVDLENGQLLRAQASAAMTTVNSQLRADALVLRAARTDKALETLMKTIREQERRLPSEGRNESRIHFME